MRYIVITENPMTGERTTVETKDFESLRIDQSQIVAIVDKSDQQVTYDGETVVQLRKSI
jgi:hypothetical protein